MERHYFGLSTLLTAVALLIWSIGESFAYPQGPNVSLGSNPVVSMMCTGTSFAYTVPPGSRLIITDISLSLGSGHQVYLTANGTNIWRINGSNTTPIQNINLNSGIPFESNDVVSCSTTMNLSGYLSHQ